MDILTASAGRRPDLHDHVSPIMRPGLRRFSRRLDDRPPLFPLLDANPHQATTTARLKTALGRRAGTGLSPECRALEVANRLHRYPFTGTARMVCRQFFWPAAPTSVLLL
ncbi:MAG: hypothetical protein ACYTAO_20390 [Planctomycetota bacterium]